MAFVRVDGARLSYEDAGGEGAPVVLVHGAAGASEIWDGQAPLFAQAGFRCLRYDLRGFGRSEADAGREHDGSVAADLEVLSETLRLGPFCLVAHAYGGFGALEFAADHPERLRALVISTSFGGLSDPEYTSLRARYVAPDLAGRPIEERELGASYRASDPEGVKRWLAMATARPGGRQQLRRENTLERLRSVRAPSLLIAGSEDAYAPPPVMKAMAGAIPGCAFEVIEGAGHCAYWEQPQVWNRLVASFLRRYV